MMKRVAGVLLIGCLVVGAAAAQSPSPYDVVVGELHSAEHFLNLANHDYNGHRAKAVKDVKHALHVLHQGHKGTGKLVKHTPNHRIAGKHEGQALSDAQIGQAQTILRNVKGQLSTVQQNTQIAATETAVLSAIAQIDLALAYSAKHLRK